MESMEKIFKAHIEAQKESLKNQYDYAMSYTNLIMLGGYAGFFALWGFTKEHLSYGQVMWSAFFILISIVSFVFFEVFKMIQAAIRLGSFNKVTREDSKSHAKQTELYIKKCIELTLWQGRVWIPSLVVSVVGGLLAYLILGYSFVSALYYLYS